MCKNCCACLGRFFCCCCCCCNRKKKNDVRNNKQVIPTVSGIISDVDSDNESVYNGSSTYEAPVPARENTKSLTDSGISAMFVPGSSIQYGESASSILKKPVLIDPQKPIQSQTPAITLRMEVKGIINLGGIEQEIQGMLNIGNKEENVITTQPRSVFAINKNVTAPSRDAKITYSNIEEFHSPKPIRKTMSMSNRPPIPLPRQKDLVIPIPIADTLTSSEQRILEDDGYYFIPTSVPKEKLPIEELPIRIADTPTSSEKKILADDGHYMIPISVPKEKLPIEELPIPTADTLASSEKKILEDDGHYVIPISVPKDKLPIEELPIPTADTLASSEEKILEDDGHYMIPISLPIEKLPVEELPLEELPPPLPVKQKQKQFKDNVHSYLSVYDDVPIGSGAIRNPEIIPTIIVNEMFENDVILRKKKTKFDEVLDDDHIYEDIEVMTRY